MQSFLPQIGNALVAAATLISAIVTMVGVVGALFIADATYRLYAAQQRLASIDAEIRLHQQFADLMAIAHARSGYQVSEKAVEFALARIGDQQFDSHTANQTLKNFAVLALPVGLAAQTAAIAAAASLALKYQETLRDAALEAMNGLIEAMPGEEETIVYVRNVAEKYRQRILDGSNE